MRALLALTLAVVALAAPGHRYKDHETVSVIANKVGPFANPSETYRYYWLPFCPPSKMKQQKHDLGEVLVGDRKVLTPYEVNFKTPVAWRELCTKTFSPSQLKRFAQAVEDDYYFEMFVEDLPMWGYVGESEAEDLFFGHTEDSRHYLYPHLHFSLGYNENNQVTAVNVTTDHRKKVDITEAIATEVEFSYSVIWVEDNVKWENRMDRYAQGSFLPSSFEIHWLSIINSLVLVLLLTAFLSIILMRVLKNDFTRYMSVDEEADLAEEESGWKLIHGDVFRPPPNVSLFCALIGTGAHLFTTTCFLLLLALAGSFHPTRRGAVVSTSLILFALTAGVGGCVSSRLYRQLTGPGGSGWVWNLVLQILLFPTVALLVFSVLNSIAIAQHSSAALPFGTIMIILALFVLVTFPMAVLGGILGRNTAENFDAPTRTNKVAREVPTDVPWYRRRPAHMFMAGFLPFSAIYIELHYIFASVWGHKIYTLFGILFLACLMLFVVTSFITVALTYFQLANEDHRWWWTSMCSGGSAGVFIYIYCFFYYFQRSDMYGTLQTSFFFGYMLVISFAFFCMLGFVGFTSSMVFVKQIYKAVKCE